MARREVKTMDKYVTGSVIRRLRESRKMTQHQLAEKLSVSDKVISKWETGRGYPDISLIEPLSVALGVSIIELFSGENIVNTNRAFNMLRMKLHVCPICGNVIQSTGEAIIVCTNTSAGINGHRQSDSQINTLLIGLCKGIASEQASNQNDQRKQ